LPRGVASRFSRSARSTSGRNASVNNALPSRLIVIERS